MYKSDNTIIQELLLILLMCLCLFANMAMLSINIHRFEKLITVNEQKLFVLDKSIQTLEEIKERQHNAHTTN